MENKGQTTAVRAIIDCFKQNGAVDENHSIPLTLLKLPVPEKSIRFFVEDLMTGEYIHQKDELYWFDNRKWERDVRRMMIQHLLILIGPVVLFLAGYFLWQLFA